MTEEVRGQKVIIRFDGAKCIHSRHCVLSRPDVFVPNVEGEWIYPDRATPEEIAELAHACPSGAITYARLDDASPEAAPAVNVVRVRENGPLAFTADLVVGDAAPARNATLCRCGASKTKPYCDASHVAAGFTATGEPPTQTSAALTSRAGRLKVTPLPNGPLLVEGNVELCSGTGRTLNRTQKCALCRCGGSANKPYCDGTHTKLGFTG